MTKVKKQRGPNRKKSIIVVSTRVFGLQNFKLHAQSTLVALDESVYGEQMMSTVVTIACFYVLRSAAASWNCVDALCLGTKASAFVIGDAKPETGFFFSYPCTQFKSIRS